VLLRLVFVLYAEERGLLSDIPVYVRNYSLVGLFDKLREDAGRFPDTMDQRYGAWSRLLVLFRMVHDGAKRATCGSPTLRAPLRPRRLGLPRGPPPRIGRVMGAGSGGAQGARRRGAAGAREAPAPRRRAALVPRARRGADRLGLREHDGLPLERAVETSIGVGKEHIVVGLETLLAKKGAEREKLLKETASVELTGKASEALKAAKPPSTSSSPR
jgi:hypothetical protein